MGSFTSGRLIELIDLESISLCFFVCSFFLSNHFVFCIMFVILIAKNTRVMMGLNMS